MGDGVLLHRPQQITQTDRSWVTRTGGPSEEPLHPYVPGASGPKSWVSTRYLSKDSCPELPMVGNTKRFVCYVFYQPFEFFARLDADGSERIFQPPVQVLSRASEFHAGGVGGQACLRRFMVA